MVALLLLTLLAAPTMEGDYQLTSTVVVSIAKAGGEGEGWTCTLSGESALPLEALEGERRAYRVPELDATLVPVRGEDGAFSGIELQRFGETVFAPRVADSPTEPASRPLPDALDDLVPRLMIALHVPGVSVAGIRDFRIAWDRQYGVRRAGSPKRVDRETAFEACSMTKPTCAYTVMQLVEEGGLDLDRPLAEYVDEPYVDDPRCRRITARMVLTHTSGFPNWREGGWRGGGPLPILFEPGARFEYSGEGFLYLQRVVEQITGEPLASWMRRRLLDPVGMKISSYVWEDRFETLAAAGHDKRGRVKGDRRPFLEANAAYSLYTTPIEYGRFLIEVMRADRSASHSLSRRSIDAMLTRVTEATGRKPVTRGGKPGIPPVWWGLGWPIDRTESGDRIYHGGANGTGFRCYSEFDPRRGAGFVIMTNSLSGDELWRQVIAESLGSHALRTGLVSNDGRVTRPDQDSSARQEDRPAVFVVWNGVSSNREESGFVGVLQAATELVGGDTRRILDAGEAHASGEGSALAVDGPSQESTAKARWLRSWLGRRIRPGSTLVLLGDEKALPTWRVRFPGELTSDSFYSDLDEDGVPETAVCRILGSPELQLRQLRGKKDYGRRATILCSEDTRIHLETREFATSLARLGYEPAICGARSDEVLVSSDVIVHFGHGSPGGISNRFGETFVSARDMPELPRSPVVFVDGCGTLPVGSPLLRTFLERGAVAYVGSTETVQGMIPARFTNELVEHFLRILKERPRAPLPHVLVAARAAYVRGHAGLADALRRLADTGGVEVRGDDATHVLTVAEWVYYGDPRAVLPRVGPPGTLSRPVVSLSEDVQLTPDSPRWQTSFASRANDGQAVLSVRASVPLLDRERFRLVVRQDGEELGSLDGNDDTVYQRLGRECRGGHVSGDTYRARFLLPLRSGTGPQPLEIEIVQGSSISLTSGTGVEIWPPDFEEKVALRHDPEPSRPLSARPEPVTARGRVRVRPTGAPGFSSLDLAGLFNRAHDSLQVGGGDNASFRTWFSEDRVTTDGVPFLVERKGSDVLVSANNTENAFELEGIDARAKALHFLVWGYNRPRTPASVLVTFEDGSTQEGKLPLQEWTSPESPAAFDFENTVRGFQHAAVFHQSIPLAQGGKKIVCLESLGGTYGVIAITLQE